MVNDVLFVHLTASSEPFNYFEPQDWVGRYINCSPHSFLNTCITSELKNMTYTQTILFVIFKRTLVPTGYRGNAFFVQAEPKQAYLTVC